MTSIGGAKGPRQLTPARYHSSRRTRRIVMSSGMILLAFLFLLGALAMNELSRPRRRRLTSRHQDDPINTAMSYHEEAVPVGDVHCVGENFQHDAWMHRSCEIRNLCLDTGSGEFLVFVSKEEQQLQSQLDALNSKFITVSSTVSQKAVSLGSIRDPWSDSIEPWFPKAASEPKVGYHMLPDSVVLFPLELSETHVWDDFYAVFSVLGMFGWEKKRPVLYSKQRGSKMERFMPALGVNKIHTLGDFPASSIVCARHGAVGLGTLGSVRLALSKESRETSLLTGSVFRGILQYNFRNFVLDNLGLSADSVPERKVLIATGNDDQQAKKLEKRLLSSPSVNAAAELLYPESVDIKELARVVSSASMLVVDSSCQDAVLLATFLNRGSTLVVVEHKGLDQSSKDLLAIAAHYHLQWVSQSESALASLESLT